MATVEKSIAVEQPIQTVYNQWTQFEDFPEFMNGVEEVTQLDDKHLHWVAKIGPVSREWDAEITDQTPDKSIAWRATDGSQNTGRVTFRPLAADRTEVGLELEFDPQGITEQVGDALGIVTKQAEGDLQRFKEFIEDRGRETGAWRGTIEN
ncbi:MAG: SRPBCC family protein [Actinomycetota bacterium]|nr:SRPBCC family protein [Actinomycetota bacterium]